MNEDRTDRLYDLLPGIYRKRDAELGQPLRALLRVVAEQVNLVDDDITRLYENWFIETCEDWAVPYIADLLGFRVANEAGQPGPADSSESMARNRILVPRREVANLIRYRRRRGTLAVLELLARDASGWPARAVEFYKLLSLTQNVSYLRPDRWRTVDVRDGDALERLGGPFDSLAHHVDVRRPNSSLTPGRYNIPSVGLFVWRLKCYSVTKAPAYFLERRHRNRDRMRFTFSVLTNDTSLITLPFHEPEPTHVADELNVPTPIRRRAFADRTHDYYGPGRSLTVWVGSLDHPVPVERIIAADLSDWAYNPTGEDVAVDPKLGRLALANDRDETEVWVSYHYDFSADLGGGEYRRALRPAAGRRLYRVSQQHASDAKYFRTITDALTAWYSERADHPRAIIEIEDSGAYSEAIHEIELNAGESLELRSRNGARPVLRFSDIRASGGDALCISGPIELDEGQRAPQFTLDGVLVVGRGLQLRGGLSRVAIRHCTLVPGWSLGHHCEPENEIDASLELINTTASLTIEHSIVGSIFLDQDEAMTDPLRIAISDSILDAVRLEYEALGVSGPNRRFAHAILRISRTTVLGEMNVHAIELAENCILMGRVKVARQQLGCMRFCYVPAQSSTPRRYRCQPDEVLGRLTDDTEKALAEMRVRPRFNSVRYGAPTYCQLAQDCAEEIKGGADDESEMGVFHDLFQPQREAILRRRLEEFTPAGVNAGIILAN